MINKRLSTTLATGVAVAALTLAVTGTASADLTTRCVGEGGAVTLPTDLVVPRGRTCVLDGTTVQGDVRVAPNANLILVDATIEGEIRVLGNAFLDALDSDLDGRVILRGSFGTVVEDSDVGGDLIARPAGGESAGFVSTLGMDSTGNVRVVEGELLLDQSAVAGSVIARDSLYADSYESFIDGELRVVGSELGSVVCSSAIQGEARFVENTFVTQLGGEGPLADCVGGNYWGSDVRVVRNTDVVLLDFNIINGNLVLNGNNPVAQLGDNNVVRGTITGDFSSLTSLASPQLKSKSAIDSERSAEPAARADAIERKVDARRSTAEREATAAGKAF